jgi:flavin reductase (NADH)
MIERDRFRDALARWASGVAVVAYRSDERVVATTVSALLSLSLEPPLVLVALGPNATVRPFLQPGAHFGISILGAGQRRLAAVFADPFPVGPTPFPPAGDPLLPGAPVALACTVERLDDGGDHAIVIAAVRDIVVGPEDAALIRFRRAYHELEP